MTRDDRGSAALEVVLIAPVLVLTIFLVVAVARMSEARSQVSTAAYDAARAASITGGTAAVPAGEEAARASLAERGLSCRSVDVDVDVTGLRPGGRVLARVSCTADLSEVAMPGVPGTRTFSADAVVPVEAHRW